MSEEYTHVDDQWQRILLATVRRGDPIYVGMEQSLIRNLVLTLEHERDLRRRWQREATDRKAQADVEKTTEHLPHQDCKRALALAQGDLEGRDQEIGALRENVDKLETGKGKLRDDIEALTKTTGQGLQLVLHVQPGGSVNIEQHETAVGG